jgi:hypothetical protein
MHHVQERLDRQITKSKLVEGLAPKRFKAKLQVGKYKKGSEVHKGDWQMNRDPAGGAVSGVLIQAKSRHAKCHATCMSYFDRQ